MSLFNDSTLFISARSPFARRVRITFLEHGVNFKEVTLNVFETNPELNRVNPLRRVPAIKLANGEQIVDSNYILQAFYEVERQSPWMPHDRESLLKVFEWSGVAVGVCEKIVETYIETLRPSGLQDASLISENRSIISDCLNDFEYRLGDKKFLVGSHGTQADIDWGCALHYLQLRMPDVFELKYPKTFKYFINLAESDSFKKTTPPKA